MDFQVATDQFPLEVFWLILCFQITAGSIRWYLEPIRCSEFSFRMTIHAETKNVYCLTGTRTRRRYQETGPQDSSRGTICSFVEKHEKKFQSPITWPLADHSWKCFCINIRNWLRGGGARAWYPPVEPCTTEVKPDWNLPLNTNKPVGTLFSSKIKEYL